LIITPSEGVHQRETNPFDPATRGEEEEGRRGEGKGYLVVGRRWWRRGEAERHGRPSSERVSAAAGREFRERERGGGDAAASVVLVSLFRCGLGA
jgi:hypothetical protein